MAGLLYRSSALAQGRFEALESDASFHGVLFDGGAFGGGVAVGSEEEAPLGDFIEDGEATDAETAVISHLLHDDLRRVLISLNNAKTLGDRLKALDANRSNIPLPKGPIPSSMKGMRGQMRGR